MAEEKTEKISISISPSTLAAIDSNHSNRSAYFQKLATDDLMSKGMLPVGLRASIHAQIDDLITAVGAQAVLGIIEANATAITHTLSSE